MTLGKPYIRVIFTVNVIWLCLLQTVIKRTYRDNTKGSASRTRKTITTYEQLLCFLSARSVTIPSCSIIRVLLCREIFHVIAEGGG
jgi:hypothetical protein